MSTRQKRLTIWGCVGLFLLVLHFSLPVTHWMDYHPDTFVLWKACLFHLMWRGVIAGLWLATLPWLVDNSLYKEKP